MQQSTILSATNTESVRHAIAADGYRLRYRVWSEPQCVATLVLLNGLISHSGWFTEIAPVLVAQRIKVVGADRRGSGLNTGARGDVPSRQVLLSDFKAIIERESRSAPVWLAGWCWGAIPAVNIALEFTGRIRGLALLAPGLFPSDEIKVNARRVLDRPNEADAGAPSMPSPMADEMFSRDPEVLRRIAGDELVQREFTSRFFSISREMSLIAAARLGQLKCPVLLVLAAHDRAVNNRQTIHACRRIRTEVTTVTLKCDHAVQFETPQRLSDEIVSWMQRQELQMAKDRQ